jgi:annexin A7/11
VASLCSSLFSVPAVPRERHQGRHLRHRQAVVGFAVDGESRAVRFSRLHVHLQGHRDESETVDPEKAFADAQTLLRAGELIQGTDESAFNEVLCQRNRSQIRAIFAEYENITGHPFETAVENEFSFTSKESLLALVHSIRDRTEYLAVRLHDSMAGIGTDDRTLIRIVVGRSEIDLEDIKEAFRLKYDKTLAEFIEGDCSGDYKKSLLSVIA